MSERLPKLGRSFLMRPPRPLPLLLTVAFLMVGLASPFAPTGGAAKAGLIEIADGTGDVTFVAANGMGPAPPHPNGLDIKGVSFDGGDGRTFILRIDFVDLADEANNPPGATGRVLLMVCFTWNDVLYATNLTYTAGGGEAILYSYYFGKVDGDCSAGAGVAFSAKAGLAVNVDYATERVTLGVKRLDLGRLGGTAPPAAGDRIGDVWAIATDGKHYRVDTAPNGAPGTEELVLTTGTSNNAGFSAVAASNVQTWLPCDGRRDVPTFSVDPGGVRGVPITLVNTADAPRRIAFTVTTVGGLDWKPRIVPQLEIPTGNTTVTAIIDMPASTTHKQCSILNVVATDASDPSTVAEAVVNVVAVRPPDEKAHRLFAHANEEAFNECDAKHMWMNVLEEDPDAAEGPGAVQFQSCSNKVATPASDKHTGRLRTNLDANPSRDLVINTSASDKNATAVLYLDSQAPAAAQVVAMLLTSRGDGDLIAEGYVDTVVNGLTKVEIPLTIGFTRDEVASGDPSRVVAGADGLRLSLVVVPESAAGPVLSWVTRGSYVDVPIYATINRTQVTPGAAGSLLSVKPTDVLPEFAAPGGSRLFNYTILNEGAEADVALITGTFSGGKGGWSVRFVPDARIPLAAGESKVVQAFVSVPSTAAESEAVLFDFKVSSERDSTAQASVATKIVASKEAGVPLDQAPAGGSGGFAKGVPAPGAFAAFAGVAAALAAWRRRAP